MTRSVLWAILITIVHPIALIAQESSSVSGPVDKLPDIVRLQPPQYPAPAQRAGVKGTVKVRVLVDTTGLALKSEIVECSTPGYGFEEAARIAAMESQYSPGVTNGALVPQWISYKVTFELPDPAMTPRTKPYEPQKHIPLGGDRVWIPQEVFPMKRLLESLPFDSCVDGRYSPPQAYSVFPHMYPKEAPVFDFDIQVRLSVHVTADGMVDSIAVLDCDAPGVGFEREAEKAVGRYLFIPTCLEGRRVPATVTFPLTFVPSDRPPPPEKPLGSADSPLPGPDEFVPVEVLPEMISEHQPNYPKEALINGREGVVWVRVLVDSNGTVIDAAIAKTSKHESLDNAALAAAYTNLFRPAVQRGRRISCWVSYRVVFKIDD